MRVGALEFVACAWVVVKVLGLLLSGPSSPAP